MMTDAMKAAMDATLPGQALKQNGQKRALRRAGSAWLSRALEDLKYWLADLHALGWNAASMDDFRASGRTPEPASPNAWGSLPKAATRAGLLAPSHMTQKAKRLAAHARRVQLWNICPDVLDPAPAR